MKIIAACFLIWLGGVTLSHYVLWNVPVPSSVKVESR